jgi:uncharacterized protein YlzI (FlbEa/FlbD family)
MSFIELTRANTNGDGITINTAHILTIRTVVGQERYQPTGTQITMAGLSSFVVEESYEEVRKLVGLEVEE